MISTKPKSTKLTNGGSATSREENCREQTNVRHSQQNDEVLKLILFLFAFFKVLKLEKPFITHIFIYGFIRKLDDDLVATMSENFFCQ